MAQTRTLILKIQTQMMMKKITYLMRIQMPILPQRLPQLSLAVLNVEPVLFTSHLITSYINICAKTIANVRHKPPAQSPKRFLRTSLKLHNLRPHLPYARLLIRRLIPARKLVLDMGLEDVNTPQARRHSPKQRSSSAQSLAVLIPEQVLIWLIKDFSKTSWRQDFYLYNGNTNYRPCTKQQ